MVSYTMLSAICFDDQAMFETSKVNNEWIDRDLSPKVKT